MPLIAGIAFSGLITNSPIFTTVLSTSDPSFVHSSSSTLGDDLPSTIKSLFPSQPPSRIKLALPSYLDRQTRKPILQAFKKANLVYPILSETLQLAHISVTTKDYTPGNEILFHFSPTLAICRLVSTSVEEGIRESITLKESTIYSPSPDTNTIIAQFIDSAQATLGEQNGTKKLVRIIVIDPSITTTEAMLSNWNQHQSPIELIKIGFPSVALQAAKSILPSPQGPLECLVSPSYAIARIGIVNADGFVHALIPKHAVLPQSHSATFTTSKDNQTKATVLVVVGKSHRGEENLCVGKLVLHDLPKRTKGVLVVRVTVDVDFESDISVTAEEAESGILEKTVIKGFIGEHHWDEFDEVWEKFELDEGAEIGNVNDALPE